MRRPNVESYSRIAGSFLVKRSALGAGGRQRPVFWQVRWSTSQRTRFPVSPAILAAVLISNVLLTGLIAAVGFLTAVTISQAGM